MSISEDFDKDNYDEVSELKKALVRANKNLARAKSKNEDLVAAVYQAAYDAALVARKRNPKAPKADTRKGRQEWAVLHQTDWQYFKVTQSYNSEIAMRRIDQTLKKAFEISRIQRTDHPVRNIALLYGGDLVEGVGIFPGQQWETQGPLKPQVFDVAEKIQDQVILALEEFEKVHVVFEPGNHGRIGSRKGEFHKGDNADAIAGEIAERTLRKFLPPAESKRLTWEQKDHWYQKLEIGSYRAMLIHGDEVRAFGGQTPAYSLVRKGNAWASGAANWDFRDIFCGHYHQAMLLTMANGGHIRMTGSTESDNQYAAEFVAAVSHPTQRLSFVDPEKGRVTADYLIWLD